MGRTWTTAEVVALVAEAHDRPVPTRPHGDARRIMPWLPASGSGSRLGHDRTDVFGALIYSAIPHHDGHRGNYDDARPAWHAADAIAIARYDPAGYAPWAVIDPTDGSWFVTSTDGLPLAVRQRTVGMCVHLLNLDRIRTHLGPA